MKQNTYLYTMCKVDIDEDDIKYLLRGLFAITRDTGNVIANAVDYFLLQVDNLWYNCCMTRAVIDAIGSINISMENIAIYRYIDYFSKTFTKHFYRHLQL